MEIFARGSQIPALKGILSRVRGLPRYGAQQRILILDV
jgi:hypothetical protein